MSGPYWTKAWNVVSGCTPASPGCTHCWAQAMHNRFSGRPFSEVTLHPERLAEPLHWRKPQTVFVANMGDLFHPAVPFEFIAATWAAMILAPQHTFLVLTKRPERMRQVVRDSHFYDAVLSAAEGFRDKCPRLLMIGISNPSTVPPTNVWLGTTAEDQERANERIPLLLATSAAHRWVSLEPLLGAIDLTDLTVREEFSEWRGAKLDQVIVGGEAGPSARPCNLGWLRDIVGQCDAAGTACFVKQLGSNVVGPCGACQGGAARPYDGGPFGACCTDCLNTGTERVDLRSAHGSDPVDWPADLRVRELAWGGR